MPYITLKEQWCHIIVPNVHALTEDSTGDINGSFYNEVERVFYKTAEHHLKMLFTDFCAKVGKEHIYKSRTGNESLHDITNDNNYNVPHHYIHKLT
jgi:hypothetical protein